MYYQYWFSQKTPTPEVLNCKYVFVLDKQKKSSNWLCMHGGSSDDLSFIYISIFSFDLSTSESFQMKFNFLFEPKWSKWLNVTIYINGIFKTFANWFFCLCFLPINKHLLINFQPWFSLNLYEYPMNSQFMERNVVTSLLVPMQNLSINLKRQKEKHYKKMKIPQQIHIF